MGLDPIINTDRPEPLLPVHDFVFKLGVLQDAKIELRNVEIPKNRVDEQLLLLGRPNRSTLIGGLRVGSGFPADDTGNRERFRVTLHKIVRNQI